QLGHGFGVAYPHLIVEIELARDGTLAGRGRSGPVFHVVRFGQAAGAGVAQEVMARRFLDGFGGITVDEVHAPHFHLGGTDGVAHRYRARLPAVKRHVREDSADAMLDAHARAKILYTLLMHLLVVALYLGIR